MKKPPFILPFLALIATAVPSAATTLGLLSGIHVTTWDAFTGVNSAGQTPGSASADYSSTLLNTTMTAGSVTGAGDRLYSGSGPTANPFAFNLTGTTAVDVPVFSLILKFSPTGSGTAADAAHFSATLNGTLSAPAVLIGTSTEAVSGSTTFQIYRYDWSALTAGTPFTVSATSAAGHVSLDAIQIVPEPSSSLLAGLMGACVFLRRRRR